MKKDPLEKELAFYESQKESLLQHHEGQWVLVSGGTIHGVFASESEAYRRGLQVVGHRPFLVRQVTRAEDKTQCPALMIGVIRAGIP